MLMTHKIGPVIVGNLVSDEHGEGDSIPDREACERGIIQIYSW